MWRSEANLAKLRAYRGFGQAASDHMFSGGGFFNVDFSTRGVYLKECFIKELNDSQVVLIDMQGNRHTHALADITSVEKLQGIRVDADITMFVGDYLQQWISDVSYGPANDEWSFTEKDVIPVVDGDYATPVSTPPPVAMYDLVLKQDDRVMKYTDQCPSGAVIAALGSHKIVKARSLTSGEIDNCIIVRTTSKLEPNLLNNLVLWYAGSPMFQQVNRWAKLPEIATSPVEDRSQFYEDYRIMLLAQGKQVDSPLHAPEFPMHMLLKPRT